MPTQNGRRWELKTIGRILKAHVYRGAVELKGVVYENGEHEAIIEQELWNEVAALRAARKLAPGGGRGRPPKGDHLLTHGLLRWRRVWLGDDGSHLRVRGRGVRVPGTAR